MVLPNAAVSGAYHAALQDLKRQRRQTKIVETTLASLKELQKVAG